MQLNDERISSYEQTSVACPEQYEGQLIDGQAFFFRLRHGTAKLGIGATVEEARTDRYASYLHHGDSNTGIFNSEQERDLSFYALLNDRYERDRLRSVQREQRERERLSWI